MASASVDHSFNLGDKSMDDSRGDTQPNGNDTVWDNRIASRYDHNPLLSGAQPEIANSDLVRPK
ncbi:hypothetical protein N7453_003699 [Penicillium expansum]|nr:hypothetical protein N7453_003699 [Penicillium expansum]